MRKLDEIAFYAELRDAAAQFPRSDGYWGGRSAVLTIIQRLGIPEKRAYSLLEKWYGKRWIDCGTWVWGGWFTDDAPEVLTP